MGQDNRPKDLDDTDLDAATGGVHGPVEPNDGVKTDWATPRIAGMVDPKADGLVMGKGPVPLAQKGKRP